MSALPLLTLLLLSLSWPARALCQELEDGTATDRDHEVLAAPPFPLPILGPRYALVTLDLYQPFVSGPGPGPPAQNVALVLKLLRERPDVRLIFHPTPGGGTLAERGAEVAWEALSQDRFWPVCELLYARPELLQPDQEEALLQEGARLGLSPERLRLAVQQRKHHATLLQLWQRERDAVRYPPELWVNGKRLRGAVSEAQLLEESERQRERARDLLAQGVPLSALYERLLRDEEAGAPYPSSSGPIRAEGQAQRRSFIELGGSPARGPQVAPVVLVLFGSLDSFSTHTYFAVLREVMQRHEGRLRLVFKHYPVSAAGQQAALLLAQVGLSSSSPGTFFSALDGLIVALGKRYQLSYREVQDVLRAQHLDVHRLEQQALVQGGAARAQVDTDVRQAQRLGLTYGPALFVNGLPLRGLPSVEVLDAVVRDELELGLIQRIKRGR